MEDAHSPPRLRVIGTLSNRFPSISYLFLHFSHILLIRTLPNKFSKKIMIQRFYPSWYIQISYQHIIKKRLSKELTILNLLDLHTHSISSSRQFLKEFSCKSDSEMSAEKKCSVWWFPDSCPKPLEYLKWVPRKLACRLGYTIIYCAVQCRRMSCLSWK